MVISAALPASNAAVRSAAVAPAFPPTTDPLPFDDPPAVGSGAQPSVRSGTEPALAPAHDIDGLLDAHTPLLARAFAAAGRERLHGDGELVG